MPPLRHASPLRQIVAKQAQQGKVKGSQNAHPREGILCHTSVGGDFADVHEVLISKLEDHTIRDMSTSNLQCNV